jgi:hypothetical protein
MCWGWGGKGSPGSLHRDCVCVCACLNSGMSGTGLVLPAALPVPAGNWLLYLKLSYFQSVLLSKSYHKGRQLTYYHHEVRGVVQ